MDLNRKVSEVTPNRDDKAEKRLKRQGSVSENFFAVKNAALILPKGSTFGESMEGMKSAAFGGDLKTHLYAIIGVLRPQDKIKLVARLECWDESRTRYLVIVSTLGRQDTEESIIIGIDFAKDEHSKCTIGLVIPIWSNTSIKLDGDGGFKVSGREMAHTFKPVSVQALWSAYQSIHYCIASAQKNNYYYGSLYLTWTCFYESLVTSPRIFLNEWEYIDEVYCRSRYYFTEGEASRISTELKVRESLKEVMMKMDLDNCNSRDIRRALEKQTDLDLKEYKEYIDTEMMTILGQMDTASKILNYVFLGSEWNASNWEELSENGITHILNITKEVDNFFPDQFIYKNIRCHDEPTTDLRPFWNDTWKYIRKAQKSNGKCLVHCKMGISRSAATVTAFIMKENHWPMDKSLSFVREKRPIVLPNKGFMLQLQEYEGILNASAQRHNYLFRSLSESNLTSEPANSAEELGQDNQHLENQALEEDDFNRKLLDLTLLPNRFHKPCHRRSKSWSVGDGRSGSSDDLIATDCNEERHSLTTDHFSEPQELINRVASENTGTKVLRLAEKRRHWRRRHTEQIIPLQEFGLDVKPQSEDSVFANPGSSRTSVEYWLVKTGEGSLASRISAKAGLMTEEEETRKIAHLDAKIPIHSSLASPMNSPSFKSTENINVSALRSHFDDEATLKIDATNPLSPFILQSEQNPVLPNMSMETTSVKLQNMTVGSLSPCYGRSLSDSQVCKVKDIVSSIERREAIIESTENLYDERCCWHDEEASRPQPSVCFQVESAYVPAEVSIIEKDSNHNNNNNCIMLHQNEDNHCLLSPDKTHCDQSDHEAGAGRTRSLTQSELRVIREVGKTFLDEANLNDTELLSCQEEDENELPSVGIGAIYPKSSSSVKKRGIVRRMAKMIEMRVKRQLQGTENDSSKFSFSTSGTAGINHTTESDTLSAKIACQAMANSLPPAGIANRSPVLAKPSRWDTSARGLLAGGRVSDISLVAPTPYSPIRSSLISKAVFKKPFISVGHSVRRSQSERGYKCGNRRGQASTLSSVLGQPSQSSCCISPNEGTIESRYTLAGVKDTVKMFEKHEVVVRGASHSTSFDTVVDEENLKQLDWKFEPSPHSRALGASKKSSHCDQNNFLPRDKYCWMSRNNCLYQTI